MFSDTTVLHDKLTQKQKNANDYEWYKEKIKQIDTLSASTNGGLFEVDQKIQMKVNYDLFNNKINLRDFDYVCKPYGQELGELPATLTNRDIVSSKIKVLHGLELQRPFAYKVVATNEEATTRKEQEEFDLIRNFVISQIMMPIRQEIELKYAQQVGNKQLTPDEQEAIQKQIAAELEAKTPDEVRKYMTREHQDPAEAMMSQILEYIVLEEKLYSKFFKGWKHATLSAKEIYYVGIINDKPQVEVVNPLRFDHGPTRGDSEYIEDSAWARYVQRMTRDQIVSTYGDQLKDADIDDLYDNNGFNSFDFNPDYSFDDVGEEPGTYDVIHYEFVSLRKIGYVTYLDENGKEQVDKVSENYKLNLAAGDLKIDWEWIPEVHEAYRIRDIYFNMRPVPGQHKDIERLYEPKLSYYGVSYDNLNSEPTSYMDRVKSDQYLYNIIMYRLELLMASDDGKLTLLNIKALPKSMGIDINKWLYFAKALKIGFLNPSEEGVRNQDINTLAKEIDRSLISDINKYIALAEYVENRCGLRIGVTKQMEGEIQTSDAVTNTKQSIIQGTIINEPSFHLHAEVKMNVLTAICEKTKVAWSDGKDRTINYVVDNFTKQLLVSSELLDASTYGLFILNSSKTENVKRVVEQLAHAAMQNQMVELSDVIKVMKSESIQESEEILEVAEAKKSQQMMAQKTAEIDAQAKAEEKARNFQREEWDREDKQIILKETERRKTEWGKQAMLSMGFNEDKDVDKDGELDIMEVYKHGIDAMVKMNKIDTDRANRLLKEKEFEHKKFVDQEKLRIDEKKANKATSSK